MTTLPTEWKLTPPERHILLCLACDAFTWESAPGYDAIAEWTGMHRSSCIEILNRLCEKTEMRPAVLVRDSVKGRRRTVFKFNLADIQPSGQGDGSDGADMDVPDEPTVGQPSGQGDPSGEADGSNRPARATVQAPEQASTVGQPSANRPAETTPPFPSPQSQSQGQEHASQATLIDVPPAPPRPRSADLKTPEGRITARVWDATQGMVDWIKIQSVAKASMRVHGATEDTVSGAIIALYENGKPIIRQTVGQVLSGSLRLGDLNGRPKNIRDINQGMDNGQDFTAGTRYGGQK